MSDLNRNLARGLEPGAGVRMLDGNRLIYEDGTVINVGQLDRNSDPLMWCEKHPEMFKLIYDLSKELRIFRGIVKETIRREGYRIMNPNEFHRGLVSLANKIGEQPDDLRAIIEPILREQFDEMFRPVGQKSSPKKHNRRHGG